MLKGRKVYFVLVIVGLVIVLIFMTFYQKSQTKIQESNAFEHLSYYQSENLSRYLQYQQDHADLSIEDIVTYVNLNLDRPIVSTLIENPDDEKVIINKQHHLPANYKPQDLVAINSKCIQGLHYSCANDNVQYARENVAQSFNQLCEDVLAKKGVKVYSIAAYRSYDYQQMLFDYAINNYGQDHALKYYAKAGESEHNAGLAIDITLDNMNYENIESHQEYAWLLTILHEYGFILRYPKEKENITGYHYEPWHIRYVGKDLASKIYQSNLVYEEYEQRER